MALIEPHSEDNPQKHSQTCRPREADISRAPQCGVGDVDGQCDAGCCAYAKGKPLHGAQQNRFCEVGNKGVSDGRHYHQGSGKHTYVFTFVGIYQVGMERTDKEHPQGEKKKDYSCLCGRHSETVGHLYGKYRK